MLDGFVDFLILLVILVLFNPIVQFIKILWELILKLFKSKPFDLKNKYGDWAVITGSTDGVGKEYAKELAIRNINLILISRSLEKLNKTKDEIQAMNLNVCIKVIQADFSKGKEELANIRNQLEDIPIGILVNNVGKLNEYPMYIGEMEEQELLDMININIRSTTLMTRMVIESMKKRGKGAIVNVSSAADLMPVPLMAVYSASKIFVTYFSDAIREEYSKYGLTVQNLAPFYINTKMVGYSERFQNNPFVPDASTYAKNAIETLGRLNSTTGYWMHDILKFTSLCFPIWIRTKIVFFINRTTRKDYFTTQKNKNKE